MSEEYDKIANHKIALVGNGPQFNRGCQAILYGTKKILEHHLGPCSFLSASFAKEDQAQMPLNVKPIELDIHRPRWGGRWWKHQMRKVLCLPDKRDEVLEILGTCLKDQSALLSVGGDNYTIDYGYEIIERLININTYAMSIGVPVIIWGASIGPFDRDPKFEKRIALHFSKIDLIVVRENESKSYLDSIGVRDNVILAPDPAFVIDPIRPELSDEFNSYIKQKFVGLNLSPLLAKHLTEGNLAQWKDRAISLLSAILNKINYNVVLIPHVTSPVSDPRMDDALFLKSVKDGLGKKFNPRVMIAPSKFSCEEVKWLISRAEVFIGARTHSTIAAFSTGVPCISIAYSQKAMGINNWLFGSKKWVIPAKELTDLKMMDVLEQIIDEKEKVNTHLEEKAVYLRRDAYAAGKLIKQIIS